MQECIYIDSYIDRRWIWSEFRYDFDSRDT